MKGFGDNGTVKKCAHKKAHWRVQKKNQIDLALRKKCLGGKHKRVRVAGPPGLRPVTTG